MALRLAAPPYPITTTTRPQPGPPTELLHHLFRLLQQLLLVVRGEKVAINTPVILLQVAVDPPGRSQEGCHQRGQSLLLLLLLLLLLGEALGEDTSRALLLLTAPTLLLLTIAPLLYFFFFLTSSKVTLHGAIGC